MTRNDDGAAPRQEPAPPTTNEVLRILDGVEALSEIERLGEELTRELDEVNLGIAGNIAERIERIAHFALGTFEGDEEKRAELNELLEDSEADRERHGARQNVEALVERAVARAEAPPPTIFASLPIEGDVGVQIYAADEDDLHRLLADLRATDAAGRIAAAVSAALAEGDAQ